MPFALSCNQPTRAGRVWACAALPKSNSATSAALAAFMKLPIVILLLWSGNKVFKFSFAPTFDLTPSQRVVNSRHQWLLAAGIEPLAAPCAEPNANRHLSVVRWVSLRKPRLHFFWSCHEPHPACLAARHVLGGKIHAPPGTILFSTTRNAMLPRAVGLPRGERDRARKKFPSPPRRRRPAASRGC